MDLNELIKLEISNGYGDANAQAKVCQDIILKAIATSSYLGILQLKAALLCGAKLVIYVERHRIWILTL